MASPSVQGCKEWSTQSSAASTALAISVCSLLIQDFSLTLSAVPLAKGEKKKVQNIVYVCWFEWSLLGSSCETSAKGFACVSNT